MPPEASNGHEKTMDSKSREPDEAQGDTREFWQGHEEEDCSRKEEGRSSGTQSSLRAERCTSSTTTQKEVKDGNQTQTPQKGARTRITNRSPSTTPSP